MKDAKQLKEEYEKIVAPRRGTPSPEGAWDALKAWDKYKRAEKRERKWKE